MVRLLPVFAPELFKASSLGPLRNALRAPGQDKLPATLPPTAHYNCHVLEDCLMRKHLDLLFQAVQRMPALKGATHLLRRWAVARGLLLQSPNSDKGAQVFAPLNGFCLSVIAAHAGKVANVSSAQTSSFQLFKLALSTLASTDWATQKVIFGVAAPAVLSLEEKAACSANFYDAEGTFNFFWQLGPFIGEVRRDAQRTLEV